MELESLGPKAMSYLLGQGRPNCGTCVTSGLGSLWEWCTVDYGGNRQHSSRDRRKQKIEQQTEQRKWIGMVLRESMGLISGAPSKKTGPPLL